MRALVYNGARDVSVKEVPDATIEDPTDAVIRITTTNICGSDLHMYEGRAGVEEGTVIGHENMGIVEEVGPGTTRVKKGDRVSVPFNIACGTCRSCNEGWTSFCERTNPTEGMQGAAYGYANMGPYRGGQAEYLRVPYADFNLLTLPPGDEHESDFTMLSDIFPTGWHGVELSGFRPGDRVAIMGAGPVGLMAAHTARIRGARDVFVVDQHPDRLKLASEIDCTPIDFSKGDPVQQILDATDGEGVDRGVEAVGWQAHDTGGDEHPELTLDNLVQVVKAHGGIGVVGVFVPQDPKSPGKAAEGRIGWDYGTFFTKGQQMGTGQAPVKRYNRQQLDLILAGVARPSFIVSHEIPLDEAPDAYRHFDQRDQGWTKVLLKPSA
ncbi:glutathione-independent formaldehyde dehydrogenase [Luteipulveratus sp. YIM 133132]|uniref:glutathione-independent formaldehyde dehydrogenase n=1 Tax=Luteipulveratus flavus TaxID=3031728 RepID=UPI0023AEEF79|nr:glutathione-independent formaldehyde dehydrogenase [Luteipulveratus sp. YIM 133132]MDE9365413.1 glutathione-independent formaldehyde dehydrogenase [Luteipulveratus sp. YIM 133132]